MKNDKASAFPLAFCDGLAFICGESASERLLKVRRFIAWQLLSKARQLPDAQFQHAVKAAFLARQRQPFTDQADLDAFAAAWLAWWNEIEVPRVRRTNASLLNRKKPIDPDNAARANASA